MLEFLFIYNYGNRFISLTVNSEGFSYIANQLTINRQKREVPSLFEIKQKADICRNRERWENKWWGAQRAWRWEVKTSGSDSEFDKLDWWPETHRKWIQCKSG